MVQAVRHLQVRLAVSGIKPGHLAADRKRLLEGRHGIVYPADFPGNHGDADARPGELAAGLRIEPRLVVGVKVCPELAVEVKGRA